ncbi:MAG: helix-turn-helix transcriptional regulator [Thermoleophilaceae bacterium]
MSAAEIVRDTRERHRLSQASLARRCRTSQTHISRIERGAVSPSVETLERILAVMGERLELRVATASRGNSSVEDARADAELSAVEALEQAAELSFALTTIAESPHR